jgi:uncharacterized membrane protein
MAGEGLGRRPSRLGTGRLEAFSDGVFATAVTLLVVDIAVPANSGNHLLRSFADEWPAYLAYAVSFSTIGAGWLGHRAITGTSIAPTPSSSA